MCRSVPFALVHHANQYLISNDYDNRQGIEQIVGGYTALLRLHEKYGIPVNLHLSGTLIEAVAWYCPEFLALVREMKERKLLAWIGGTYAEHIMPYFSSSFNLQQLQEYLWLFQHHLRASPEELTVCWIPERVWDSAALAPVISSKGLANGGYRFVLLDDRLLYEMQGGYAGSPRNTFDVLRPYSRPGEQSRALIKACMTAREVAESCRLYRIAGAENVSFIPICADLRYWIPPATLEHWRSLEDRLEALKRDTHNATLLVYADDLEKAAGVGGWNTEALPRYDALLHWIASRHDVLPVLLPDWLAGHIQPAQLEERAIEAGTFFELARGWKAGEDYHGWWYDSRWSRYKAMFEAAQHTLEEARKSGAEMHLVQLAQKHLMASTYETAWHDGTLSDCPPAPSAKALASHARAALVITAAARWFAQQQRPPHAMVQDIDNDAEDEVILAHESLYAVIAPRRGGRLIYLFALLPAGGVMVIGNPTDDWNFQEELNRYMQRPPNHPGALADLHFEDDRYRIETLDERQIMVEISNQERGSQLFGAGKRVQLLSHASTLVASYHLPRAIHGFTSVICLSPDYYRLLREGRSAMQVSRGANWFEIRNGRTVARVELAPSEVAYEQDIPASAAVGHGLNLRLCSSIPRFRAFISCEDRVEQDLKRSCDYVQPRVYPLEKSLRLMHSDTMK